jgi:hypothetical protein
MFARVGIPCAAPNVNSLLEAFGSLLSATCNAFVHESSNATSMRSEVVSLFEQLIMPAQAIMASQESLDMDRLKVIVTRHPLRTPLRRFFLTAECRYRAGNS